MIDLYVVESPLQALSAAEAKVENGKDVDSVILVRKAGEKRLISDDQIAKAVSFGNWDKVVWFDFSEYSGLSYHLVAIWYLIKLKRAYHGRVRKLYIGEFRSEWMLYLRCAISPLTTYLLDDGAATVTIQNRYLSRGVYWFNGAKESAFKSIVKRLLYLPVYNRQVARSPINLFTAFELSPAPDQEIVRHSFGLIRNSSESFVRCHEVFYFGAKYSEAGIMALEDEMKFLKEVSIYYQKKGLRMVYVPHRDDSCTKISIISDVLGLSIKKMDCPAELYFAMTGHRPYRVSAAYSSVLNNLRFLFGCEVCDSFIIPGSMINGKFSSNISAVYKYYRDIGLNVIDLDAA